MKYTLLALALAACGTAEPPPPKKAPEPPAPPPAAPAVPENHKTLFKALEKPAPAEADKAKIALGQMLYFDTRLSANGKISCATCHDPAAGGDDGLATSPGHEGKNGDRNSNTTLNAALQFVQFWDGRAANVEEQAKGPILNPVEMGIKDGAAVEKILSGVEGYKTAFAAAWPDGAITFDRFAEAVGAYERQLVTPGRFDTYLKGDVNALSEAERKGLDTFISTGCIACHSGALLGGSTYQKLGAVVPYETKDLGRKAVTGADADLLMFKVPQLRNIAQTGPYFHDGAVATLEQAVTLMGKHQLGKDLSPDEVGSIVTFLKALDGTVDPLLAKAPTLP
jgi:cytochrome c peroxidase